MTTGTVGAAREADFEGFFVRELGSLEAIAYGLTGRRGLAEELAQEAMLVVYRRWNAVAAYDDPAAFARRVVANKAVSAFRRLLAEARALNRVRQHRVPAGAELTDSDEALWAAVRRLPARQAQAVALRYVGDLDTAAVAAVLGCSEGNVRVLLHRARQTLAATLDRGEEGDG
jgi:RNA polymerase sigma-70 factor (ECF subfamily)